MRSKTTILVVDDEERNRIMLNDILTSQGYEVVQAEDGIKALERVEDAQPDVILLDLRMPNMGGLEVIRELKEDDKTKSFSFTLPSFLRNDEYDIEIETIFFRLFHYIKSEL